MSNWRGLKWLKSILKRIFRLMVAEGLGIHLKGFVLANIRHGG